VTVLKFALLQLADEVIKQGCRLPLLARTGHTERVASCLLSGAKRKTSARSELFRFRPGAEAADQAVRTSDTEHQIRFLRDGRRKAAFLAVACGVHRCASANIMLDADPTLRSRPCPISLIVSVALSGLHQIAQQVRRHRQLGERKATGSDLLDRLLRRH